MSSRHLQSALCTGRPGFVQALASAFTQVRLEENPDRTGLGALRLFDARLYKAAAKVQHSTSWSGLITAGGSTSAVMAHPTSYPNLDSAGSLGIADDTPPSGGAGGGSNPGACAGELAVVGTARKRCGHSCNKASCYASTRADKARAPRALCSKPLQPLSALQGTVTTGRRAALRLATMWWTSGPTFACATRSSWRTTQREDPSCTRCARLSWCCPL